MYRTTRFAAAASLALSLAASAASAATTVVLDFDDLVGTGLVPSDYQGVNFGDDFSYYDDPLLPEYPSRSGLTTLYSNYDKYKPGSGSTGVIRFDDAVRFDGAWFAGHYDVVFDLYLDGQQVHVSDRLDLDSTMRYLASGYAGLVDEVRLYGNSGNWVMDDLTYTTGVTAAVPEPATWAMMMLGFGAAGAALRSRRRIVLA
ncbi:PEPxxWA-CTERM sorting domain-containing protein [Phenylobacterium sp.]|uniref:PEPxxWA-CTERM sorting domain-containing protein n=1 Tax=Phenylobacterium sp. TaxID=1871053 RepID=UPI0025EF865E|nr:PEPxxWA-CTERM sorting domain-containing protein [Phenylobacterium sp.]